jgi:hypothetical protein
VDSPHRNTEGCGGVVKAQSADGNQVEGVSIVGINLKEGESQLGQVRSSIETSNHLIGFVIVQRDALGSGICDQSPLLRTPVVTQKVGGNAIEPWQRVGAIQVVAPSISEGGGEGLSGQVVGFFLPDSSGDISKDLAKVSIHDGREKLGIIK